MEGKYYLDYKINVTDIYGYTSSWEASTGLYYIDFLAPTISDVTTKVNGNVTVTASDNGSGIESYSFDGGLTWQESETYTYTTLGTKTIQVKDALGNISDSKIVEVTIIDSTVPTISVEKEPTNWTNGAVTLTITASDTGLGLEEKPYSFDGGLTWQAENTKTYEENTSGILIKVRDIAENIANESIDITNIDKTNPTIQISPLPGEIGIHQAIQTIFNFTDRESSISAENNDFSYYISSSESNFESGEWKSIKDRIYWNKEKGVGTYQEIIGEGITGTRYVFVPTIQDNVGNISKTEGSIVTIDNKEYHRFGPYTFDNTVPTISSVTKSTETWTNGIVTLTVTGEDNEGGSGVAEYSFDGGQTWQTSNQNTYEANISEILIKVKDAAGNISSEVIETITNIDKTAPQISINSEDVVREGLIGYYNAFNNTGNGHSDSVTEWKNLREGFNDATIYGGTQFAENYLSLDGVDDYLEIKINDTNFNVANMSIQLVFRANNKTNGNGAIFSVGNEDSISEWQGNIVTDENGYAKGIATSYEGYEISGECGLDITQSYYLDIYKIQEIQSNGLNSIAAMPADVEFSGTSELMSAVVYIGTNHENKNQGIFEGLDLYEILIYERQLTDEEKEQNYFASLSTCMTWAKSHEVKISISDYESGLAEGAQFKYGWSTSSEVEPETWMTTAVTGYLEGEQEASITIEQSGLTGKYYLWIEPITLNDTAGNSQTDAKISESTYWFDNTAPNILIQPDTNTDWKKSHSAIVKIVDNHSGLLLGANFKYGWSDSQLVEPENFVSVTPTYEKNGILEAQFTVAGSGFSGNYYLWVLPESLEDSLGNTQITIAKSEVYNFDNTAPEEITINPIEGNDTPKHIHTIEIIVSDALSGLAAGAEIKYGWSESLDVEPSSYTTKTITGYTTGTTEEVKFPLEVQQPTGKYYFWLETVTLNDVAGNSQATAVNSTGTFYFDNTAPQIIINPTSNETWGKTHTVQITLNDGESGLAEGAQLKYGWTEDITIAPDEYTLVNVSEKISYISGTNEDVTFEITGSNLTGKYHLWVVPVILQDAGGKAQTETAKSAEDKTYWFDNEPPVITVEPQGNILWNQEHLATVTISDTHSGLSAGVKLKYTCINEKDLEDEAKLEEAYNNAKEAVITQIDSNTMTFEAKIENESLGKYYILVIPEGETVSDILGNVQLEEKRTERTFYIDETGPWVYAQELTNTEEWRKEHKIAITLHEGIEHGEELGAGLAIGAKIEYGWSTSNEIEPTEWEAKEITGYEEGALSTIYGDDDNEDMTFALDTGIYYFWVRPIVENVKDTIGNLTRTSTLEPLGPFYFDNTTPEIELEPNSPTIGTRYVKGGTEITVKVQDEHAGLIENAVIKYQWVKEGENLSSEAWKAVSGTNLAGEKEIVDILVPASASSALNGKYKLYIKSGETKDNIADDNKNSNYNINNLDGHTISEVFYFDNTAPTITFNPYTQMQYISKGTEVLVTISDKYEGTGEDVAGLDENISIQYQWATSRTALSSTAWETITGANEAGALTTSMVVPASASEHITGIYYLFIKAESFGDYVVTAQGEETDNFNVQTNSEQFRFDNAAPKITMDPTGNRTWQKSHTTTVTISDIHSKLAANIKLKYGWSLSTQTEPAEWFDVELLTEEGAGGETTISFVADQQPLETLTGKYYLIISVENLYDMADNTANGAIVTSTSRFYFDNTGPQISFEPSTPITGTRYVKGGIDVTIKAKDYHSGLAESAKIQYQWVKNGNIPDAEKWIELQATNTEGATNENSETEYVEYLVPASESNEFNGCYKLYVRDQITQDNVADSEVDNTNKQTISGLFYFDTEPVRYTLTPNDKNSWSRKTPEVTVEISDWNNTAGANVAGLDENISIQYQWVKEGELPTQAGWQTITGTNLAGETTTTRQIPESEVRIPEDEEGTYYLYIKEESVGDYTVTPEGEETDNTHTEIKSGSFKFDKVKPTVSFAPTSQATYSKSGKDVIVTLKDTGAGLEENTSIQYQWVKEGKSPTDTGWETVTGTNTVGEDITTRTVPASATANLTGKYYLYIKEGCISDNVTDDTKNTNDQAISGVFNFDNTGIELEFITPSSAQQTDKWTKGTEVIVKATDQDSGLTKNAILKFQWVLKDEEPSTNNWTSIQANNGSGNSAGVKNATWTIGKSYSSNLTGEYILYIKQGTIFDNVSDESKNTNEALISGVFQFDAKAPVISDISITQGTDKYYYGTPEVQVTITDSPAKLPENISIQYQWVKVGETAQSTAWTTQNGINSANVETVTVTIPSKTEASGFTGEYKLFIKAGCVSDTTTENFNQQTNSEVVLFDNTKPTISFSPNTQTVYSKATPEVTVTISDSPAGLAENVLIQYQWVKEGQTASETGWLTVTGTNSNGAATTTRIIPSNPSTGFTGNYYLAIKQGCIKDDVADSTIQNSNVQTNSSIFYLDNTKPEIEFAKNSTTTWSRATAVVIKVKDVDSGLIENAQIQYQWVKADVINEDKTAKPGTPENNKWSALTASNAAGLTGRDDEANTEYLEFTVPKSASEQLNGYYNLFIREGITKDNVIDSIPNANDEKVSGTLEVSEAGEVIKAETFKFDNEKPKITFDTDNQTTWKSIWIKGGQEVKVTASDSYAGLIENVQIQYQWVEAESVDGNGNAVPGTPTSTNWTTLSATNNAGTNSVTLTIPAAKSAPTGSEPTQLTGYYSLFIREGITKDNVLDNEKNSNTETVTGTVTTNSETGKATKVTPFKFDNTNPNKVNEMILKLENSSGTDYDTNYYTNSNVYISLATSNNKIGTDKHSEVKQSTYTVMKDGVEYLTNQTTANTLTEEGIYTIIVTTEDNAVTSLGTGTGNISTLQYTVKIDKTKPTVSFSKNSETNYWSREAEIIVTAKDTGAGIVASAKLEYQWVLNGEQPSENSWTEITSSPVNAGGANSVTWTVPSSGLTGKYSLYIKEGLIQDNVQDSNKNTNAETKTTGLFFFDNEKPTISFSVNPSTDWIRGSQAMVVTASDSHAAFSGKVQLQYQWSTSLTTPTSGWITLETDLGNTVTNSVSWDISLVEGQGSTLLSGEYTLYINEGITKDNVIDSVKNSNEKTSKGPFKFDNTVPNNVATMSLTYEDNTSYSNNTWTNKSVYIKLNDDATDEHSGVKQSTYTVLFKNENGEEEEIITDSLSTQRVLLESTGEYTITITTEDKAITASGKGPGNKATRTYTVKIDKILPELKDMIIKETNSSGNNYDTATSPWTKNNVYIAKVDGSDKHSGHLKTTYSVLKDGKEFLSNQSNPTTLTGTGIYTITVTTTDNAGNFDTNVYTVKIDQTAPNQGTLIVKKVNSSGEEYDKVNGPWTKQNIYIAINNDEGSDEHSGYKEATYTIKKDGASYCTNETAARTLTETGIYEISITAIDNVGNTFTPEVPYIVKIDKKLPVISFEPNEQSGWTKSTEVIVKAEDSNSGLEENAQIQYQWVKANSDGTSGTPTSQWITLTGTNLAGAVSATWIVPSSASSALTGEYNLFIKAGVIEDNVIETPGNKNSQTNSGIFHFDNTIPEKVATLAMNKENSSGTDYENNTWTNKSVYVKLNNDAYDEHSQVKISTFTITKDGQIFKENQTSAITLDPGEGNVATYEIIVTTTDNVGNINTTAEANKYIIKIDKAKPVISSFQPNEQSNWTKTAEVTVTATDEGVGLTENAVMQYQWVLEGKTPDANAWSEKIVASNKGGESVATWKVSVSGLTGKYKLYIKSGVIEDNVTDNPGNTNNQTNSGTYYFDNTEPSAGTMTMKLNNSSGVTYYSDTWTKNNVYVSPVDGSDAHSGHQKTTYTVLKNGEVFKANQTEPITLEVEDKNSSVFQIIVTTIDNVGNSSTRSEYIIKIDKRTPTVATMNMNQETSSGAEYINDTWINKSVYLAINNGVAQDLDSGLLQTTYSITRVGATEAFLTNQKEPYTLTEEGEYIITVTTEDRAGEKYNEVGNTSSNTYKVKIDLQDPILIITGEAEGIVDGLIRHYDAQNNLGNGHANSIAKWKDLSGNNDAKIEGGATFANAYITLDGNNDWINLGQIKDKTAITLEASIKLNAIQSGQKIVMANYQNGGMGIHLTEGKPSAGIYINGNLVTATLDEILDTNRIYNISATYDGATLKLYIDGVLQAQKTASGTITNPSNNTVMAIGANVNGETVSGEYANIKLYSARIYEKALTKAQIDQNLNADRISAEKLVAKDDSVELSFIFNEGVTGFDASDITVTNGTKGTFTKISNTEYTLEITGIEAEKDLTVKVAENSYIDKAGNNGNAPEISRKRDTISPTATITTEPAENPTNSSSITYNFKFSESIVGLEASEIEVTNGTKGNFTKVSSTEFKLVVTNNGTCLQTIKLLSESCSDDSGNVNAMQSKSVTIDRTTPTVTITPTTTTNPNADDGKAVQSQTVTIKAEDIGQTQAETALQSGLNEANVYEYYLSSSLSNLVPARQGETWKTFSAEGTEFTIDGLTGTYYIFIKQISDKVGNTSDTDIEISGVSYHKFGPYVIDSSAPTITAQPSTTTNESAEDKKAVKSQSVNIIAVDIGKAGLVDKDSQTGEPYLYYLSTSSNALIGGKWTAYTGSTPITLGENLTGTYYLFTKQITDNAGNASQTNVEIDGIGYHKIGEYVFDNSEPIIALTPNQNKNYKKAQSVVATVKDAGTAGLKDAEVKYLWVQGTNEPTDDEILVSGTTFINNQTITKSDGTGNDFYLWAIATDNVGNTTKISSIEFWLDNTIPTIGNVTKTTSSETTYTLTISDIVDKTGTTNQSGIKGYYISTDSTPPTESSSWAAASSTTQADKWIPNTKSTVIFEEALENTTYYIWAIDNVGNISEVKSFTTGIINFAVNDEAWYEIFEDAVKGAVSGDTIKVLKNVTDTSKGTINKNLILDTNGMIFTKTTSGLIIQEGYSLEITGEGKILGLEAINVYGELTVTSGTISREDTRNKRVIFNSGVGDININGGTIVGRIFSGEGMLYLNGGTIQGNIFGGNAYTSATIANIILDGAITEESIYGAYGNIRVETTNIILKSGTAKKRVYGGANIGTTNITLEGATVEDTIYGGGSQTGAITTTSKLNIKSGTVGSVVGGGNGAGTVLNSNITIQGDAVIKYNVIGGGNGAPIGTEELQGNTTINIAGGEIGGTIYGGSVKDFVYGNTTINIGKDAISDDNITATDLEIKGNIYGGGTIEEATDYSQETVTGTSNINIDGNGYTTFNVNQHIFGSGRYCDVKESNITIKNVGEEKNPLTVESIQRTDLLTIDNSNVEIVGISDSTNANPEISFALNRIVNLKIKNGTSLHLRRGFNKVEEFNSLVDIEGQETKASVTILDGQITENNVINRVYVYEGINLIISKEEYEQNVQLSDFGKVNGMTFFGMYARSKNTGNMKYDIYDPSSPSNLNLFKLGSYAEGLYDETGAITVDGFYTNIIEESTLKILPQYIDVMTNEPIYQDWIIGGKTYTQEVTMIAKRNRDRVYQPIYLDYFNQPSTEYNISAFTVNSLEPNVYLTNKENIPTIETSQWKANTYFALSLSNGAKGWQTEGETTFHTLGEEKIKGTMKYISDDSGEIPYLDLYLYNSINIDRTADCGLVTIVMLVKQTTQGDPSQGGVFKVAITINIQTLNEINELGEFHTESYITEGKNYGLFTQNEVHITDRSSMTLDVNTYPIGTYGPTDNRVLSSTYELPENTEITMIDYAQGEDPIVYYYVVEKEEIPPEEDDDETTGDETGEPSEDTEGSTGDATEGETEGTTGENSTEGETGDSTGTETEGETGDSTGSETEDNTEGTVENQKFIYKLSDFKLMGTTTGNINYSNPNDIYKTSGYEQLRFIFDFKNTSIEADALQQTISLELREGESELAKNIQKTETTFNIYNDRNTAMTLKVYEDSSNIHEIFGDTELKFRITTKVTKQFADEAQEIIIEDTYYHGKKLGISISLYDEEYRIIPYEKVKGSYIKIDGEEYYFDLTGKARIYLADNIVTIGKDAILYLDPTLLSSGKYNIRIDNFVSHDGAFYGVEPEGKIYTGIQIIDLEHGLQVEMKDEDKLIDYLAGKTYEGDDVLKFDIKASDIVKNTNIRMTLYRRDTTFNEDLTYADISYTQVDLQEYVSTQLNKPEIKGLTSKKTYEYLVSNEITENTLIELALKLNKDLSTGGYKIAFEFYSGNKSLGKVERHFVVTDLGNID